MIAPMTRAGSQPRVTARGRSTGVAAATVPLVVPVELDTSTHRKKIHRGRMAAGTWVATAR